jgi:glutaredoxin
MRILLVFLVAVSLPSFAEIYKWVDESGRVHYGDSPRKSDNAEKVTVRINSYESVTYGEIGAYGEYGAERVVMYSTSWCGYCKKARQYFEKNNIRFTEYDIEKDRRAKHQYDQLGGKGVPVILVGKKRMNGFSEAGFERIYQ